jgi:hypothetical protein
MAIICGLAAGSASAATRYIRGDSALASGTCVDAANPCTATYVLNGAGAIAQDGDTVIALRSFSPFSVSATITIQHAITLRGQDGPRVTFYGSLGGSILSLAAAGVRLSHVRVQNTNAGGGTLGASATVTIDDAVIDGAGYSWSSSGGSLTMTDTLLRCGATAFVCTQMNAGANPVTLRRVHVDDSLAPPNSGSSGSVSGSTLLIEDSSFTATSSGMIASATTAGTIRRVTATAGNTALTAVGPVVVSDSAFLNNGSGPAFASAGSQTIQLRNVTAVSHGDQSYGITAGGGQNVFGSITPGAPIVARNVIARGDTADLNTADGYCFSAPCSPPAPSGAITVDHSNFRATAGSGTITKGAGNQSADPLFAGTEDFHLLAGSPAIEAGLADALDGPTDLDGNPRVAGAAPDIGAYEGAPPPPAPAPAPAAVDTTAPTLAGLKITRNGAQIRFSLSEAAKATLTINRLLKGRRSGKRCVKSSAKLRKAKRCTRHVKVRSQVVTGTVGTNTVKGKALAPGTYEVLLTAVDAAGNKTSKTLTAKLVVKRAKKKR